MTTPSRFTQTSLFSPTQISGCQLWFDAADSTTFSYSSGSSISQWRDKSSNAYTVIQPTSGNQPTLTQRAQNSLPGIQFATNTFLYQTATSMSNFTTGTATSVLIAARNASVNTGWNIINTVWFDANGSGATQRYHFSFNQGVTDGTTLYANATLVGQVTSNAVAPSANAIFGFTASPLSTTIHTNGSVNSYPGVPLPNATGSTAFVFNDNRNNSGVGDNIVIFEMVGYNTQITVAERQQLEGYLAWKWGLQGNLPSNHPYKQTPVYALPPFPLVPQVKTLTAVTNFQPTQISGCQIWLDAADASTVTLSGNSVTAVRDKSLSNITLSNASGFTYPNNTFNGRYPSFFVNGGGQAAGGTQRLGVNATLAIPTPFTVSFVCQHVGGANYGYILDSGPSGSGRPWLYDGGAGPTFQTVFNPTGGGLVTTSPLINSFIYSPNAVAFQNGTQQFTGAVTVTTGGITVGNRFSLNESWPGHICEFIIHNTALSTVERQQIEGYLAWKWGLQRNLPNNHPYKQTPVYAQQPFPLVPRVATMTNQYFNPASIGNCQLWIDVPDSATLFSGSSLTFIRDKVRNISVSISPTAPTYSRSLMNNLPGITFGGASWLRGNFQSSYTGNNLIVFAVGSLNSSTATYARLVSFSIPNTLDYQSTSQVIPIIRRMQTTTVGSFRAADLAGQTISYLTNYMFCSEYTGSTNNFYVNANTPNSVSSSGNFNISNWGIGYLADYGGTNDTAYWIGNFGECIAYLGSLTLFQRQQVEGYLAWKWGFQASLPANHPFKLFPPSPQ